MPQAFFGNEEDNSTDHPEHKAVSDFQSVDASRIILMGISESGATAEGYIPHEEREKEVCDFWVDIMLE